MEEKTLTRIRKSIEAKLHNLSEWMVATPTPEKQQALDRQDDAPVQEHLAVLDKALERVECKEIGVCVVCHGRIEDSILQIDYTAEVCLDCLSEVQRRELETELQFSSEIQRALLPQQAPDVPGLEIGAFSRPAQIVTGDYFDFFRFKNGAYGFAIADVSGHGFSSSLLMSSLQMALHTLTMDSDSIPEVIRRINQYYLHNTALTTFVTLFVGAYDPEKRVLTYANAGHTPPLLYHRNGKDSLAWLAPTGAAVGILENYSLRSEQIWLNPNDVLLLYTDGVTELTNTASEFFGMERLQKLLSENAGLSASGLVSALRQELDDFNEGKRIADDLTIVAIKGMD